MDMIESHIWVQIAIQATATMLYGIWRYKVGYKAGAKDSTLALARTLEEDATDPNAKQLGKLVRAFYNIRYT